MENTMYQGSCLCGAIRYELQSQPKAASHCHCRMCQKQHGAAFATYVSVPRADFRYLTGEELLSSYNSSTDITRKFCSCCGSSLEWSGSSKFPDWLSISLATFDTPFYPEKIREIHQESRVCWLQPE